MRTPLLRALRSTIRIDSHPRRQSQFATLARSRWIVRLFITLHAHLGRSWLSTLLVSTFGLKSFLEVARPRLRRPIAALAVHANAREQIARVERWLASGMVCRIRTGRRGLFDPGVCKRVLVALTSWRDVRRVFRILHRVNGRHDFLVSCRSASLVAYYLRARQLLASPHEALLVSSDTNPEELAFAAVARDYRVPTLFIAHAYPSPFAPPLDFTLSMLEGEAALDLRRALGPITGDTVLVGVAGHSKPMDAARLTTDRPVVGICAPKVVDWPTLTRAIDACLDACQAREVRIRWHPSMLDAVRLDDRVLGRAAVVQTSPDATLDAFTEGCDWIVADLDSNVHLQVLRSGVPSVALERLGGQSATPADLYRLGEHRIVPVVASLDPQALRDGSRLFGADWVQRFRRFDAAYLTTAEVVAARARAAIEPLLAPRRQAGGAHAAARSTWRTGKLVTLLVSAVMLFALYRTLDVAAIARVIANASVGWLIVSVGMIVPLTVLRALRFQWVAPTGAVSGLGEALRLTLVASAFNMFLPSKAGDFIKGLLMARTGTSIEVGVSVVVYERVSDLFGLICWCVLGWWIANPLKDVNATVAIAVLIAAATLCGVLTLSNAAAEWLARSVTRLASAPMLSRVRTLAQGWPAVHRAIGRRRWQIAGLSLFLWLIQLAQIWLFAVTISISISFAACASLAAIALMAGQLPITFNGVGARDIALVVLLADYTTPETAAALGLLTTTRGFLPPLAALFIIRPYLAAVVEGRKARA